MQTLLAPEIGFDEEVVEYLRVWGQECDYSDGATIVRRGDPGRAFYIVTSGEAEVVLTSDSVRRLTLARLTPGCSFGEMSLIKSEPISADVVARGPTTVLAYPAEHFQEASAESAPLRNHILTRLSDNVRKTNAQVWDYFQRTQAFSALMQTKGKSGPVIAESPAMLRVQKQLAELGGSPVILITGEPGTGKLFIARTLHEHSGEGHLPFIVTDCADLGDGDSSKFIFGSTEHRDFTNTDTETAAPHLLDRGTLHLADGGTLVLRHIDVLDPLALDMLSCYVDVLTSRSDVAPRTRIIATTCQDLSALAKAGRFPARLVERLSDPTVELPPLLKRKKDILPLARLFLSEQDSRDADAEPHQFTESAKHALLSVEYRHRNVAELAEAIEFAVLFADGPEVSAEHIFTGPKDQGQSIEYDLGRSAFVQWLMQRGVHRKLQAAVFVFFAAIAICCLTAGGTLVGRVANGMVWGLWWPALIAAFLFMGRIWCTFCPVSSGGRSIRKIRSLNHSPPQWIKKHAGWIMAFLFFAIIWVEHVFRMPTTPFATGIFLLTLVGASVVLCAIYQKEVGCRFMCPLGALAAGYSVSAAVHVRANPGVCSSQCKTHECVKGTKTEPGCPVYHHPLYVRDAHFCKLCGACLRNCPHGSARPYLRPLLQDVWRVDEISLTLVPFALTGFFLAMVMLASHWLTWTTSVVGFTSAGLLAVGLAVLLNSTLPRLLSRDRDADPTVTTRVAFALLVLGWGPFMAFHLANVPGLGSMYVHFAAGSRWAQYFATTEVGLLTVLEFAAIAVSAVFAVISLSRIRARAIARGGKPSPWGWRALWVICGLYFLAAISLILPQGVHP